MRKTRDTRNVHEEQNAYKHYDSHSKQRNNLSLPLLSQPWTWKWFKVTNGSRSPYLVWQGPPDDPHGDYYDQTAIKHSLLFACRSKISIYYHTDIKHVHKSTFTPKNMKAWWIYTETKVNLRAAHIPIASHTHAHANIIYKYTSKSTNTHFFSPCCRAQTCSLSLSLCCRYLAMYTPLSP